MAALGWPFFLLNNQVIPLFLQHKPVLMKTLFLTIAFFVSLFSIAQPTITFPPNNAVDVRIKTMIQWSYDVVNLNEFQLDTTLNFNSPLFQTGSSITGAAYFNTLKFNTKYYLRARTIHKSPVDTTNWSTVYNFKTLDTFEVTSPSMNSTNQNVSLSISFKSSGSITRLWVDTTPSFNSPILRDSIVNDSAFLVPANPNVTSVLLTNLYFNKKYYVRGRAYANGDSTAISKTFIFTTKVGPVINSPYNTEPNVVVNTTATFSYMSSSSVDSNISYTVQMDTSQLFNSPLFYSFYRFGYMSSPKLMLFYNKKYYIRVRAAHKNDTSAWSNLTSFTTVVSPGGFSEPYLVSPDTLLNVDSVYFQTPSYTEVKRYEFKFDTSASFNSPKLISDTMALSTYGYGTRTVKNLYFNKNYYVAIRMISSVDTSTWYIKRYTTISSVKLLQPGNGSTYTITNPILTWTLLKSMKGYTLQLDTSIGFNSPLLHLFDSSKAIDKMVTPDLLYNQIYYWRIKVRTAIDTSSWSTTWNFSTSPFATYINSPYQDQQNVAINPTSFTWDQPAGGRGYHYQISTDSTFATGINGYILDPSTTFLNYNGLNYGTKYFFRVRVYNNVDSADWYYLRRFYTLAEPPTPGIPNLISPANNSTKQSYLNLLFTWASSVNSLSYDVEISESPQFLNPITGNTSSLSIYATTLNPATFYYWHVRGVNGAKTSVWSAPYTFTTMEAFNPPTGLDPDNFKVVSPASVQLSWSADANATRYEFQFANDPYFSGSTTYASTNAKATISNLTPNLTYYWRVRSVNALFVTGWSTIAIFRTSVLGIEELVQNNAVTLFPNPTNDLINIQFKLNTPINSIDIFNSMGDLVEHSNGTNCSLSLGHLTQGLYFVKVNTKEGTYSEKFLLKH